MKPTGDKRQRVDLTARWTNVQMHVVHAIYGAHGVAGSKACPALESDAREFSVGAVDRHKAVVVKHLSVFVAAHVNMNV